MFFGLLLSVLIATVAGLMFFGVTIDLNFIKGGVEASAQAALGREVSVDGPVVLEFSNWPAIEVSNLHVANVADSSEPLFFSAGRARLKIGVFPLFRGNIEIAEITAEDVQINLETDEHGRSNWVFDSNNDPTSEPADPQSSVDKTPDGDGDPFLHLAGVKELTMQNISLGYRDASLGKEVRFQLEKLAGTAAPGDPIKLDFSGTLMEKTYDFAFAGGSLERLLSKGAEPWTFNLDGVAFEKKISVEGDFAIRQEEPQANFAFDISEIDIGTILSQLGLVEGLTASTGTMGVTLSLEGSTLDQLVRESSLAFTVREGSWRITSPTSDGYLDVDQLNGDILVEEGNNVTMKLSGMVDKFPVNFVITGAPLVDYVTVPESIPLRIDAEIADSSISLSGDLALPITSRDINLSLKFMTDSLDNLNEFFRLDLPPIGPVDFLTEMHLTDNRYEMSKLGLQIGESQLAGKMTLDPSGEIPEVTLELISDLIRIDDFDALFPSDEKKTKTSTESDTEKQETEEVTDSDEPVEQKQQRNLLSQEVLGSFNADLLVNAKEVISGDDNLGSAMLKVTLKDSLLSVDPLEINVPSGGVMMNVQYQPSENGVDFNFTTEIEEFDIGVLVRRNKPESDMGGRFYMSAALQAKAPDLASVMENASGHFDFGLQPKNFSAGIIDLWAVNLLSAILTEVSEEEKSEINCAIVRFGIENGIMKEKAIYMDTSNMRISGKADIDFKSRQLKITMVPKAKQPEFFSLAVPIKIDGTFDDFGLGIGITRLTGAIFSFITSPVHVPIRRIFVDEIPEDGQEACRQAWDLTEEDG